MIKKSFVQIIPILFVLFLCFSSFLVYNLTFCVNLINENHVLQGIIYIIIYNVLLALFLYSYMMVTYTDPGSTENIINNKSIKPNINLKSETTQISNETINIENLNNVNNNQNDEIIEISDEESEIGEYENLRMDNSKKICKKCMKYKPERAHHCSICKRCVLKMDHHCPWLSNCVGFKNYKYFILFLFYGAIYIIFQFVTILISFIQELTEGDINELIEKAVKISSVKKLWLIQLIFTFTLGFTIFIFLLTHVYQVLLCNETTLEKLNKERIKERSKKSGIDETETIQKNIYNVGMKKNFIQVFGKKPLLWLIPVYTTIGNGYEFPKNI